MWRHILAFSFIAVSGLTSFAQTPSPAELQLDLGSGVTMDLVLIKPGRFQQGAPASEAGREDDETQRQVIISDSFYIGKYPVTRGQFGRFVESTRHRTEAEKGQSGGYGVVDGKLAQRPGFSWRNPGFVQTDDHPVVIVTAQDAKVFCQWLSKRSGRTIALPSEAQWEYACRAGTSSAHYLEPVNDVAWHRGNSDSETHPVGEKKPNAWGLYDLYGPVWQWCRDWYAPYPAGPVSDPLQTNPKLSDKPRQVLRGGSFLSGESRSRSAERYRNDPSSRNADNGFRIISSVSARPVPPPSAVNTDSKPSRQLLIQDGPDIETSAEESSPSFGVFGWMGLFIITVLILIGFKVIRAVFKAFGSGSSSALGSDLTPNQAADFFSSQPPPLPQRFSFRVTDSGFYITGPEDAIGSQVEYTADVGDRVIIDSILYSPGPEGQFIFTGSRPKSVTVRTLGGLAGTTGDLSYSSFGDDSPRRSSFRSSASSRSYPSAY